MLCCVIWLLVKRLSQKAIQRLSQRDGLVKIKVFKLRRDADDILCSITLRSAGGVSFRCEGPTTAKARFWDREVRDHGIRRSQRSVEHSGREERADSGIRHGLTEIFRSYYRLCWDLGAGPCSNNSFFSVMCIGVYPNYHTNKNALCPSAAL